MFLQDTVAQSISVQSNRLQKTEINDFSSLSIMYGAKVPGRVVLLDNIDCQQKWMIVKHLF